MAWDVEHTNEFAGWYLGLPDEQQEDITAVVMLLIEHGPDLPFPSIRADLRSF